MTIRRPEAARQDDAEVDPPPAASPEPQRGSLEAPGQGAEVAATQPDTTGVPPAAALDWSPAAVGGVLIGSLVAAAFFSTLAASLMRAVPSNVGDATDDDRRRDLERHLERTETLGASASLAAYAFRVFAALALYAYIRETTALQPTTAALVTAGVGGPLLHLLTQSLPVAIARSRGRSLVAATVPTFARLSKPLVPVVALLRGVRRAVLRAARTPDTNDDERRLVEGFRAMVEGSEFDGDLAEDTRELIANVIEFGEADAAEVMTPRTEIRAIEEDAALADAVAVFAEAGYSRIPVYEDTIDTIIGTLTALEAAKAVAEGRLETTRIRDIMRPPLLVPETVPVPALLAQFRAQRQKMAIVVDEYGGTAGLVTLADVIAEIVGHVKDEYEQEDLDFRRVDVATVEANAGLHVSEVNEELELEIPEESDYETLAGFVLSELGRFPSAGEEFTSAGVTFRVTDASDRRVLRVAIERAGGLRLASEHREDPAARPAPRAHLSGTDARRQGPTREDGRTRERRRA